MGTELKELVRKTTSELWKKYPIETNNSYSSLWLCGLNDGSVSQELFDYARFYYGRLWSYTGD